MSDALLTAIIGGICTAVPTLLGVWLQNRSTKKLLEYRLDQVEKKVGLHNGHEEKIHKLEMDTKILSEKIAVANHRIEDLEKAAV